MEYIQFLNSVTWVDTFLTMVIPFFIIIIVNTLVLRTIIRGRLQSRHSVVISNGKKPHSAHKKVDTFTISEEYFLLQEVTMVLYYVTFSCNFVIYTLFGRNFKTSLMLILKCRSATEERRRLLLKGL
ncbi:hypothetical protein MAR_034761, partial [Mya arenaria]